MRADGFFFVQFPSLIPLIAVLLLGSGCGSKLDEDLLFEGDRAYGGWVGKPAGEVKFTALDGSAVDLAAYRGRVVLLDFWATWCGPCMRELPHLKEVYQELHGQGFDILGISFDTDRAQLERVVRDQQIAWPQYFGGGDNPFGRQFGIRHYPSMWLVDQQGVVRFISAGAGLKAKVVRLLREQSSATPPPAGAKAAAPLPAGVKQLQLTGISGSGERGVAIIKAGAKNLTFTVGDERVVPTATGDVTLKCVEVSATGAVFQVNDHPEPLRLRAY